MILVFCSLLFASIFAATSHFAKRDFFLYISILFSLISCGLSFALIQHINFESTLDNSVFKFYELYRFTFINDNNTSIGFRIDTLSSIWIITSNIICLFTCLYYIFYMKKTSLLKCRGIDEKTGFFRYGYFSEYSLPSLRLPVMTVFNRS